MPDNVKISQNLPSKRGFYFARKDAYNGYFHLIARLEGEAPMLYLCSCFEIYDGRMFQARASDLYYGPEIIRPEVANDQIRKLS